MFRYGTHRAQQEREGRGYGSFWSGVPPEVTGDYVFNQFAFHAPYSILGLRLRGANNAAVLPGQKGYWPVPFDCTISYWTLLADQLGSIIFDIKKVAFADFPPGADDTIISLSAERPALSNALMNMDRRLAGWNIILRRDEILAIDVVSATSINSVTLSLFVTRNSQT